VGNKTYIEQVKHTEIKDCPKTKKKSGQKKTYIEQVKHTEI
jgi:hypothetical protein